MSYIYFDCYSGVAGDMLLASLLDLGVDRDLWLSSLKGLAVEGYDVSFDRTERHGIYAQQVIVEVTEDQPHRHLKDIKKIINDSQIPREVKNNALRIFTFLAEAEAQVHGSTIDKVHFHEVGAVDAIVDIVGVCLALDRLGITKVYSSPIGLGRGISKCDHGPMPLPPPATLELLSGCLIHFHEIDTELATPTGAAIIRALASFDSIPDNFTMLKTGYGAGAKILTELPNVVRALLLETPKNLETDRAVILETNIDDMNPEIYPHVIKKLIEQGAMDVFLAPIIMKKGRPGVMLSVLCPPDLEKAMIDAVYDETSTLGIRLSRVERLKLPRKVIKVKTPWGVLKGKEARWKGNIRRTPEFEECRRISEAEGIPLQEVYKAFYAALSDPLKD